MRIPNMLASLALVGLFWGGLSLADELSPLELFEQRIAPIFKSADPSSCVQCHLSSVDLKDYILPSSRDTFLSLRDQGLIDVDNPPASKILDLIAMGEQDADQLAVRIHAKTRQAEYAAFSAWIQACCLDPELVRAADPAATAAIGPTAPRAVIRHNRKDRVLDSFVRNIWSQRMRCFPCHTPHDIDLNNPLHKQATERHRDFVKQFGQRMNIFNATPEATLRALVASSSKRHGDKLPLINTQQPLQSLLLLKPTAKLPAKRADGSLDLPSAQFPVTHMGGIKMHQDDHSYKAFAAWLEDYAQASRGSYDSADALPRDNWFPTEQVLQIQAAPEAWPVMSTVQLFVFAWDADRRAWCAEPLAFTQAKVAPRRLVSGSLFLLASAENQRDWQSEGERLPAGKYLIRVFVDRDDLIARTPTLLLHLQSRPADAETEIEAKWELGFKNAERIRGESLLD